MRHANIIDQATQRLHVQLYGTPGRAGGPILRDLYDEAKREERARIVAWLRSPEAHNIVAKALHISDRQFPLEGPNVLANELEEHRD